MAPKDATNAAAAGGVDAVCAAGKTEGQVNIIATPPDWANYGQIISDFTTKYGIKVQSDKPDGEQPGRDRPGHAAGRHRRASPTSSTWRSVVASAHTDMFAPYQVATWADIPDANKEPTGLWVNNYTGFMTIGYDAKLGDIQKVADLADPKYKGKVALNGDPLKASAGFNGVVMASLANAGSADNIAPGVDFMKKLADMGNLIPVDPNPGTVAAGTTPIVIDWTYTNNAQTPVLAPKGITWKVVVPSDAPAGRRLLQLGHQQGCRASGGRSMLDGIHLLGRRPECVAEGLRTACSARRHAKGRDRRPGGVHRRSTRQRPRRCS